MNRSKRRLPIPQHEFGFAPDTFNLSAETTLDGERIARERDEEERARRLAESKQASLFTPNKPRITIHPYGLRAGDIIRLEGRDCTVVRVNDCAAVVAVAKPPREFTTLFGKRVRIQPKPALVRISSQSEVPILNR
jgi:hypothetical protein